MMWPPSSPDLKNLWRILKRKIYESVWQYISKKAVLGGNTCILKLTITETIHRLTSSMDQG